MYYVKVCLKSIQSTDGISTMIYALVSFLCSNTAINASADILNSVTVSSCCGEVVWSEVSV